MICKPLAPRADGLAVAPTPRRPHCCSIRPRCARQSLPLGFTACDLATPNETLQNVALLLAELDRNPSTSHCNQPPKHRKGGENLATADHGGKPVRSYRAPSN